MGGHYVLDLRVLLERIDRHVLSIAALLVSAVRHLVHERDVRVDPYRAEPQLAAHAQRAADVPRPDRGGEAVVDAVGKLERLVLDRLGEPELLFVTETGQVRYVSLLTLFLHHFPSPDLRMVDANRPSSRQQSR